MLAKPLWAGVHGRVLLLHRPEHHVRRRERRHDPHVVLQRLLEVRDVENVAKFTAITTITQFQSANRSPTLARKIDPLQGSTAHITRSNSTNRSSQFANIDQLRRPLKSQKSTYRSSPLSIDQSTPKPAHIARKSTSRRPLSIDRLAIDG